MSNYISKSALIDFIVQNVIITTEEGLDLRSEIVDLIKNQPTVDEKEIIRKTVERIVKKLEKHKSDWNDDYNVPINNAIEIVKKAGGLNE